MRTNNLRSPLAVGLLAAGAIAAAVLSPAAGQAAARIDPAEISGGSSTAKPVAPGRATRSAAARADLDGTSLPTKFNIYRNGLLLQIPTASQQAGAPPNYSPSNPSSDDAGNLGGATGILPGIVEKLQTAKPETASRTTRSAAARADAGSGYQYKNYLNNPSASAVRSATRSFSLNLLAEKVNSTATKPETASRTTRNAAARGTAVVSLGPTWPVDVDADPATTQRSAPNRNQ